MAPFDTAAMSAPETASALADGFGRAVSYLRLSVTDRCDLRCVYCMPERMRFLPKAEVLSLEELGLVADAFIGLGVRKIRITGGEPLVRKGVLGLIETLSRHLGAGLDELALSTNGTRLAETAADLAGFGVRRVNVSLDTLDPARFHALTRGGDLGQVQAGIDAALGAGLAVKINVVALARDNAAEIPALIQWAHARGCDLTLIEAMPIGEVEADRTDQFLSLSQVRRELESFWTLTDLALSTGGPARYARVEETGGRLGFITPLSHTFCEGCNRVRVTCTGTLHTCLGQEDAVDLRGPLRRDGKAGLVAAIRGGVGAKPRGHDFRIGRGAAPAVGRVMAATGG